MMAENIRATRRLSLPAPTSDPELESDVMWQELQRRFTWYDRAATRSRVAYYVLKLTFLLVGAAVTVLAAVSAHPAVTATLAASLVVLEGVQQLFRLHANWIGYRATAETLRTHALAYVSRIEPYDEGRLRRERLGEFLRDLALRENANWTRLMKARTAGALGAS